MEANEQIGKYFKEKEEVERRVENLFLRHSDYYSDSNLVPKIKSMTYI